MAFFMQMRFGLIYSVALVLLLTLTACFRHGDRENATSIPFQLSSQSSLFTEDYFSLSIDSADNYLHIQLKPTKKIKSFPFPKDKNGQVLSGTAFTFSLCTNNSCIQSADLPCSRTDWRYYGYNSWLQQNVCCATDTFDLTYARPVDIKIPMYVLHHLKRGRNSVDLVCRQDMFCSAHTFSELYENPETKESTYHSIRNYSHTSPQGFTARFDVNVPQIFKTVIYGYGIELRNDSTYSPAGMDNTIWNSSYPDVYWTINFPGNDFYCSSNYQKSTDYYDAKDTFYLYHYTPYDSISIGVWDHDNLSRDDYIAQQRFSLSQFPQGKQVKVPFGNVKAFELKVVRGYAVNN